jgi:DNA repair exonuclease SbcCD ATPase subunit
MSLDIHPGLTLIEGINHHYASNSSNAAGKSTLEEIISYASFGRTLRGLDKDSVINRNSKCAMVWNEYKRNDGGILRIERYRKHPKYGNEARLLLEGKNALTGRYIKDSDAEIVNQLGFNYDLFARSVVLHSRVTESYASVGDRYLKQITERLINLPDFKQLTQTVKDESDGVRYKMHDVTERISILKSDIASQREEINNLQKKSSTHEKESASRRKKLTLEAKHLRDKIESLKMEYQNLSAKVLDTKNKYEATIRRLKIQHSKIEGKYKNSCAAVIGMQEMFNNLIKQKNRYRLLSKKGICPECKQQVSKDHIKKKMAMLDEQANPLPPQIQLAKATSSNLQNEMRRLNESIQSFIKKDAQRQSGRLTIQEKLRSRGREIGMLKSELSRTIEEQKRTGSNPYTELLLSAKKKLKVKKEKLEHYRTLQSKRKRTLLYYDFWRHGFGPNGIRSFVLDSVMPIINPIANIYLDALSDGNMFVELNTVKQNKDGTYSDRFSVELNNASGSDVLTGNSDGELSSVDLALNLAMCDMLSARIPGGFNFLFIDQAIDLLDTVRGRKAIRLLQNKLDPEWCKANKVPLKKSIWLITHKKELKDMIDQRIVVEKKDGGCSIVPA